MRNDQIAVLLRDFARRALEWAAVLEKQEAGDPVFDRAFIEHGTFSVRLPAGPTTSGTPPISVSSATTPDRSHVGNGGASLRRNVVGDIPKRGKYFGGTCRSCNGTVWLTFDPSRPPEVLDAEKPYVCTACYASGRRVVGGVVV